MLKPIITLLFIFFAIGALGQQGMQHQDTITGNMNSAASSRLFACPRLVPVMPHGNRARAIAAQHCTYSGDTMIAQLGYIDSLRATVQEIWDNFEIGLTLWPESEYKIVSYNICFMPKGRDLIGPYDATGDTISFSTLNTLGMYSIKPGDQVFFGDIRIQKQGSNYTLPLKGFKVVAK